MQTQLDPGLVRIDNARLNSACEAYFKWKDLNTYVKSVNTRGINIPDCISEPIACWCLGYMWNRGSQVGDATDGNGNKIEFKATSRWNGDLSSFGPSCTFDNLVYLRFDVEHNKLYIYDLHIDSHRFGQLPANQHQTIRDQQMQGRRPHVSLQSLFVDAHSLQPDIIFDIRQMRIERDNR